jgi:hypothetical protein
MKQNSSSEVDSGSGKEDIFRLLREPSKTPHGRKVHNEELHDFYKPDMFNIIRPIYGFTALVILAAFPVS